MWDFTVTNPLSVYSHPSSGFKADSKGTWQRSLFSVPAAHATSTQKYARGAQHYWINGHFNLWQLINENLTAQRPCLHGITIRNSRKD
ncbi:hypothetical protein D3C79_861560 [compost metagenome]